MLLLLLRRRRRRGRRTTTTSTTTTTATTTTATTTSTTTTTTATTTTTTTSTSTFYCYYHNPYMTPQYTNLIAVAASLPSRTSTSGNHGSVSWRLPWPCFHKWSLDNNLQARRLYQIFSATPVHLGWVGFLSPLFAQAICMRKCKHWLLGAFAQPRLRFLVTQLASMSEVASCWQSGFRFGCRWTLQCRQ